MKVAFAYNIKEDLKTWVENWIYFLQDKCERLDFVNTVMNLRVPQSI